MAYFIMLHKVCFTYENSSSPLFDNVSCQLANGWTGIVGANGSGKSTLLKLITGNLEPDSGTISGADFAIYCEQRTDDPPEKLAALMQSTDFEAINLKRMLALQPDWPQRWDSLSHGERKRCQIAVALFCKPRVLAVDEPTNHLDQPAC